MNHLLAFISRMLLPPGNNVPPSVYKLDLEMEVDDWQLYEHHVCDLESCKGHVWEPLARSKWKDYQDDKCPLCQGPRFTVDNDVGVDKLNIKPVAWYIDFGIETAIKDFFHDPLWAEQRGNR